MIDALDRCKLRNNLDYLQNLSRAKLYSLDKLLLSFSITPWHHWYLALLIRHFCISIFYIFVQLLIETHTSE